MVASFPNLHRLGVLDDSYVDIPNMWQITSESLNSHGFKFKKFIIFQSSHFAFKVFPSFFSCFFLISSDLLAGIFRKNLGGNRGDQCGNQKAARWYVAGLRLRHLRRKGGRNRRHDWTKDVFGGRVVTCSRKGKVKWNI